MKNYIMNGDDIVPVDDILEWGRWFEKADRIIKQETVGDKFVSTVFLGVDHNFGGQGPPLLFETMVFPVGSWAEEGCWRASTKEEALRFHDEAVASVKAGGK